MIRLEKFERPSYERLISWIDSAEMLMQFGGPVFSYPLTSDQLAKMQENKDLYAFDVVDSDTGEVIGHAEIFVMDTTAKLARILIGSKEYRGKGLCTELVKLLLEFVSAHIDRSRVELNVFDWNIGAIRCYEKVGFSINPDKTLVREVNGKTWTALNMVLDRN